MDLFPAVTDPTGAITQPGSQTIALQPGDYLVSYKVSATLSQPGYMQVTPSYGGAPHLEYGVYFATTATGSSAVGSAHFILPAPSATTFSLTYSGSVPAQNGVRHASFEVHTWRHYYRDSRSRGRGAVRLTRCRPPGAEALSLS